MLENSHDRSKELALERRERRRASLGNESNECRDGLKGVLVELGVGGVSADVTNNTDETLEDSRVDRRQGLSRREDDSHDA